MTASGDHRGYDAELREWGFSRQDGALVAFGRVHDDRRQRWPDGYAISTSEVTSGAHRQGAVIRTRNTRYLLSGPPGDLGAMLVLARDMLANSERREKVAKDERLFDLLPAAWGMDDQSFEKVAGLSHGWLREWRNHYRAPTDQELARIRRLMGFHEAIRLVTPGEPNYSRWWQRRWPVGSRLGGRSPLEAVLTEGDQVIDDLELIFRSQAGW